MGDTFSWTRTVLEMSGPGSDATRERIWLAGARLDLLDRGGFLEEVSASARGEKEALFVSSFNLNHLAHYGRGRPLEGFFADERVSGRNWLVTIDGEPVRKRANKFTGRRWDKLNGSGLIESLLEMAWVNHWKVANVGGSPEAFSKLSTMARERWAGLDLRGWSPRREDVLDDGAASQQLLSELVEFKPDIIVISLPKPLSEIWASKVGALSGAKALFCFGGSVDFLVGEQNRAPGWVSKAGLEWAWRLVHNPRRLFRRYVLEGPGEWIKLREASHREVGLTPPMWRKQAARILIVGDLIVAFVASFGASVVRSLVGGDWLRAYAPSWLGVVVAIPVLVLAIGAMGARRVRGVRIDAEVAWRLVKGVLVGVAGVGLISYVFKLNLSRGYVGILGSFALIGGLFLRGAYARRTSKRRKLGYSMIRCGVVGYGSGLAGLLAWFESHPQLGYKTLWRTSGLPEKLPTAVGVLIIDDMDYGAIAKADELMRELGEVMVVPALTTIDSWRLEPDTFANQSVLHLLGAEMSASQRLAKRSLDIIVAGVILLMSSPLLGALALGIYLEDRGPVLFRQVRVGEGGAKFTVLKLRTMHVNAEERLGELLELNEAGGHLFKMRDDPRITHIGKFLRRTSMDELPQLVNVLRGEMSLVGPRPALPHEVDAMAEHAERRHRVRPGLTGLWQVSGRSDLSGEQALELDLHYVANWSLTGDLTILLKTVKTVLGREGAA